MYTGYTRGHNTDSPIAGTGVAGTLAAPGQMHGDVRFLRPLIVANHIDQTGIYEISYFIVNQFTWLDTAEDSNAGTINVAGSAGLPSEQTLISATVNGGGRANLVTARANWATGAGAGIFGANVQGGGMTPTMQTIEWGTVNAGQIQFSFIDRTPPEGDVTYSLRVRVAFAGSGNVDFSAREIEVESQPLGF